MGKKGGGNRHRMLRLWNENPNCHWCGIETVPAKSGESRYEPDTATFDHLYERFTPERKEQLDGKHCSGVLSCRKCNQRRGHENFEKAYPLEVEIYGWEVNISAKTRREIVQEIVEMSDPPLDGKTSES